MAIHINTQFVPSLMGAQTHADALDGTAGKGLFFLGGASYIHDIYVKCGASTAFTAVLILDGVSYPLGNVTTAADRISVNRVVPENSQIKVTASSTGNHPTVDVLATRIREVNYIPGA